MLSCHGMRCFSVNERIVSKINPNAPSNTRDAKTRSTENCELADSIKWPNPPDDPINSPITAPTMLSVDATLIPENA